MSRPVAIDLFCGLGGWTDGLLAEGYDVTGFDIEEHAYGGQRYPGNLVIQDVKTLQGAQFKGVALIVASPPCQEYSYMAMPWKLAKAKAAAIRADATGEKFAALTNLFNQCFRIQREASFAAGKHIPMVVENVKGAQPWVGRARWNFGSFYLWGDVPALMPLAQKAIKVGGFSWSDFGKPGYVAQAFNGTAAKRFSDGRKNSGGSWFNIGSPGQKVVNQNPVHDISGQKLPGNNAPRMWSSGLRYEEDAFYCGSSGGKARKAASAMIAKIPLPLSRHVASTFRPANV